MQSTLENLERSAPNGGGANVGRRERWISGAAGVALAAYGLRRKRLGRVLLPVAAGLIGRAVTARCPVNRALGRDSTLDHQPSSAATSVKRGEGIRVEQSVTINRPAGELYQFWRRLDTLPRFMDHLESVEVLDPRRSRWVAKGPVGTRIEWDAEIYNEIAERLLAWRSLPQSDVDQAGSVHFEPLPDGSTEVRVVLRYDPPAGKVGATVARLLGEDPARQVAEDLRRFKQVMEASEGSLI